jgi:hypothetical protein
VAALTADRKYTERGVQDRNFPVKGNVCCWANGLVAVEVATGLLKPAGGAGGAATDAIVGWARFRADNRGGANSAISCEVTKIGARPMNNSAGGNTITLADVGKPCYAVDDQTLSLTDQSGALAYAGIIHNVTELGVWLEVTK